MVVSGLLGETPPYLLDVVHMKEKGRGVVVRERVPKGSFVCEYEATTTYQRKH